ncbi:MAG: hypothetical protein Q7I95_02975, partial [Thiobacillus sp.]|nr:hypothetical protein [Thiobacillus sp.]
GCKSPGRFMFRRFPVQWNDYYEIQPDLNGRAFDLYRNCYFIQESDMTDQVQITIDQEVYDRLQILMVPPIGDANAVIKALLYHNGSDSPAAVALKADGQHFTYEQELERSRQGVYESGGGT